MYIRSLSCILGCLALLALLISPANAAQVTSITICEQVHGDDFVPVNITDKFSTDAPIIHGVVEVGELKTKAIIKGAWVSIDAINVPDYEIDSYELSMEPAGHSTAHFSLSRPDNGWPPGNYRLEVYLNDNLSAIKTFSIVASAAEAIAKTPPQSTEPPPPPMVPQSTPQTAPVSTGYSGTFIMNEQGVILTLVMEEDGRGGLTGTLSSNSGTQMQLEGVVEEGSAYGACYDDMGGVFFEAYIDLGQLYFALIEPDANNMPDYSQMQELMFTRQTTGASPATPSRPSAVDRLTGKQNPTPPSNQPSSPPPGNTYSSTGKTPAVKTGSTEYATNQGRAGKTYRHPVGFSFWYPEEWTLQDVEGGYLQLIPPNAGTTPEGPTELYFLGGENVAVEGIFTPDDPRVVAFLDEQVKYVSPNLQYTGNPTSINMSQGKGVVLNWKGQTPRGDAVIARSYVCVINGHGVALTGVGFPDQINARDKELKSMFASFGFGQGQNDPQLIGSWRLVSTYSLQNESVWESDWSRAQAVSETQSVIQFHPDGTWSRTDDYHMIAGAGDLWLESKDQSSSHGRWNAADGFLIMVWDDNSYNEYQYRFKQAADGLRLQLATGKKGEEWSRE